MEVALAPAKLWACRGSPKQSAVEEQKKLTDQIANELTRSRNPCRMCNGRAQTSKVPCLASPASHRLYASRGSACPLAHSIMSQDWAAHHMVQRALLSGRASQCDFGAFFEGS